MSTDNKLKALQAQAQLLGLEFHHRLGIDKLRTQIGEYLVDNPEKAGLLMSTGQRLEQPVPVEATPVKPNLDYKPVNASDYKQKSQKDAKRTVGALRRIQFTNMNPTKKEWKGELISVGSSKLGTWKKYVFFNGKPYHVPQIIYDVMKERQCSAFETISGPGGDVRKSRLINEYAIVDLPPLTQKELKDLADRQALGATGL